MQLTTNVQELLSGLTTVTRALAARAAKPVLDGVLLEANEDEVTLTCSDGSLTIQATVAADVKEIGRAVLPGKLLTELVRKLPGGEVTISVGKDFHATITCLSSRSKLAGMDPMEYPEMAEVEDGQAVRLGQKQLKDMISRVVFAIATDESRQILTGVLMEMTDSELRLVALDGFRLAMQRAEVDFQLENGQLKVIVPGRVMNELSHILPDEEEECTLEMDKGHMTVSFGKNKLSTVLLAGEYIDYRKILPQSFKTVAKMDRVAVQNAIDRASLMAREGKNNLIRMAMTPGSLVITSNAETGDVREEMLAVLEGDSLEIAFNAKYITDVIRNITDEELCMHFNSNVSPAVVAPEERTDYLYLILPVRVF